jgi:hypothetical protein
MSTTIFERIALAQLLVGGCAVVVGLIIMPTISQESSRQQQQLAYNGTALQHFVRSRRLAKR